MAEEGKVGAASAAGTGEGPGSESRARPATEIRVALPAHLRTLARLKRGQTEVRVEVAEVTIQGIMDALEAAYPMLRGTIRGHRGGPRRPHMRYYGNGSDLSFHPVDAPLDAELVEAIASGREPFIVIGAISGG